MNTSIIMEARAKKVAITTKELIVYLTDGRVLSVPLAWFPKLLHATAKKRKDYRLIGGGAGIHWNALDEDLSVSGLLER